MREELLFSLVLQVKKIPRVPQPARGRVHRDRNPGSESGANTFLITNPGRKRAWLLASSVTLGSWVCLEEGLPPLGNSDVIAALSTAQHGCESRVGMPFVNAQGLLKYNLGLLLIEHFLRSKSACRSSSPKVGTVTSSYYLNPPGFEASIGYARRGRQKSVIDKKV